MKAHLDSISVNGIELFYKLEGSDSATDWITLLNGYSRTHSDFNIISRSLASSGYKVLTLDNRGSGRSIGDCSFSFEKMTEDISSLWECLGVERTHVVGISMGGVMAQLIASKSEKVGRLVLVSTCTKKDFIRTNRLSGSGGFEKILLDLVDYFHPNFVEKNSLIIQSMARQMARRSDDCEVKQQLKFQRDALDEFDMNSIDHSKISQQTLIIHGEEDKIIDPDGAKELASKIQNSKLVYYPECGHLILAEKPKLFYNDILNFFGENR